MRAPSGGTPSRRARAGGAGFDWAVWGLLRALLVAIILGVIPWPEMVNDLTVYAGWANGALAEGRFPDDQMWQYPPLAGAVFQFGAAMPGQRFGFVAVFLVADAAIMAMLSRQAGRTGRSAGRRVWAGLPIVVGPLLLARFDVVPTAFAVAAVLMAARPGTSGMLAALGAWMKVWPALVVIGVRRMDLPRALLGALATSAVLLGILLATTSDPLSFLAGQRDRGLQVESVAALPYMVADMFGADVSVVYRYGAHQIDAPGADAVAGLCTVVTLVLLGAVMALRLLGRLERLPAADVALAAVLVSVVASRVSSGQYLIWLLGLSAVCRNDPRSLMDRTGMLLVGAGLATHLIYPWLYSALLEANPVAVGVQTVRVALMLAATVAALRVLAGAPGQAPAPVSPAPASPAPVSPGSGPA